MSGLESVFLGRGRALVVIKVLAPGVAGAGAAPAASAPLFDGLAPSGVGRSGEAVQVLMLTVLVLAVAATYWRWGLGRRVLALADAAPSDRFDGRAERVEAPVLMELVAAALSAGAAVPRGLQATGEAIGGSDGLTLRQVGAALRLGASWSEAWELTPERLQVIGRALRPAWEDGAAPREALRAASDDLRRERRDAVRTAAAKLAVHLVMPLGLCLLPAFILLGLMPVLISLGVNLLAGF